MCLGNYKLAVHFKQKRVIFAFDGKIEWKLASMLIMFVYVYIVNMGGCQVWKCPWDSGLGQRSTECKITR